MIKILSSYVAASLASLFCIWLLRPLAIQVGFVDRPGGRKQHDREVPLIGGISVFFGFCFALLFLPISLHLYRGLIAGASLLLLIGIVDDFRELGWRLRLLGQVLASLSLILWGHHRVITFGDLLFIGDIYLGVLSIPFTVIAIVGFLNAMNMIDGQDGLIGGVALGQIVLLGYLNWPLNRYDLDLLIVLSITLIIFLGFNMRLPWRKAASIFIGDSGSTVVGFLIAWFSIAVGQRHLDTVKPITILWILAFPVFDFFNVFFHRLLNGKSPLIAGRDHFHHVLHFIGFDTGISTLLLCLFSFALGVMGIVFNDYKVSEGWQFVIWFGVLVAYFLVVKLVRDCNRLSTLTKK